MNSPENCANCGAAIPPKARACPECGADERTGWAEQSIYDGLDLPDDEPQESDNRTRLHRQAKQWFWWLIGVILILTLILGVLGLR